MMRSAIGWRICMDYNNLNSWKKKDNFFMSYMDQILDSLAGKGWYCFLYGYLEYHQIFIAGR